MKRIYIIKEKGDMANPIMLGKPNYSKNPFKVFWRLLNFKWCENLMEAEKVKLYAEKKYRKKFEIIKLRRKK